ncbi:hypothetical protein NMG60_11019846 [Bertholletia excelsa]
MARKSRGRQKIEMTRMSKESNLLVTFSKRRSGLFKKASELCTLCAAEIAVVVFSPGKKVFSFGHPSVDSVVSRLLSRSHHPPASASAAGTLAEAHRGVAVRELNARLMEVLAQLEAEKKRGEELSRKRSAGERRWWWEAPLEEMGMAELEQLRAAMEELKRNIARQAEGFSSGLAGQISGLGSGAPPPDVKVFASGLSLSMTPHGYALGYGRGFF